MPGTDRTCAPSIGSAPSLASIATGSASRSSNRRTALSTDPGTTCPLTHIVTNGSDGSGSSSTTAGAPVGMRIDRVYLRPSTTSHPAMAREPRNPSR